MGAKRSSCSINGVEQSCILQMVKKQEKKSLYVCLVCTDAGNLVRLHQMTGDIQFQTFLFFITRV